MSKFAQHQRRGQSNSLAAIAQLSGEGASPLHADTYRPRRSPTWGNQATQRLLRTGTLQPNRHTSRRGRSNISASARATSQVMPMSGQLIQRQVESEEDEEELLQPKLLGDPYQPSIQLKCERCAREDEAKLQPQLRVSQPGDKYEREADLVADHVMRMPEPSTQRQMVPELAGEETIQRKVTAGSLADNASLPPTVRDVLRRSGRPLDLTTRDFMEPRFGHNFSQIRIHTDSRAAESARILTWIIHEPKNKAQKSRNLHPDFSGG